MNQLLMIFVGLLVGYTAFPIDSVPDTFMVDIYQSGKPIEQFNIDSTNDITKFFVKEKAGWKKDNTSYAPNYLLVSDKMKVNIFEKKVIINYQNEKGKWGQYSKEVNGKELISIINDSRKQ